MSQPCGHRNALRSCLVVLLAGLWLAACTTPGPKPDLSSDNPLLQQAQTALLNEQPLQAARLYEQLAQQSESPQRESYWMAAIDAYLEAGETEPAARLAQLLAQSPLAAEEHIKTQFLIARLQLEQGQPEQALATLDALDISQLPQQERVQYYRLRSDAYLQAGNLLESAQARVSLDALLVDEAAQLDNQQAILNTLMLLSNQALELLKPALPNPMAGWMELALLLKSQPVASAEDQSIAAWRESHPFHMANDSFLQQLVQRQTQNVAAVASVAVLLPESGPYEAPARAIRQGIVSAALERTNPPARLRFYDTESAAIGVLYNQALAEGADAVIGPLDKNKVAELAQTTTLSKPVLALNHAIEQGPEQLFQFGLRPEEEAEQVASLAWTNGHLNVLILTQQSDFGQRVARHFSWVWGALGGKVVDVQAYHPDQADHSAVIRTLLNLDDSANRRRDLVRRLNLPIEFEERRRHDADFIFLVAQADAARQIKPQLRFHRASDLPVYATSSVFSGTVNASLDQDLNDIVFCDMPWLIDENDFGASNAAQLSKHWPNVQTAYKRLFSLGLDAYQVLPHLQQPPGVRLPGNSGILSVNAQHHIQRQLSCAEFQAGVPRKIGLAPQLKLPQSQWLDSPGNGTPESPEAITTPLPVPPAGAQTTPAYN